MAIPEVTETKEETEAGIREHGEWIMGHPELCCRILSFGVQRIGGPLTRSRVTRQATQEVAEMCTNLGTCFAALGEAIFQENNQEGLDLDATFAEFAKHIPNPRMN